MFSVLIPVKGEPKTLPYVLRRLEEIKETPPHLIGEILIERHGTLPEARRKLAKKAIFCLVLNLDADTIIHKDFLSVAEQIFLKHSRIGAVAVDYYNKPQGHAAFGASVMQKNVMMHYYHWESIKKNGKCECLYMWEKLINEGYIVATIPLMAKHKR